MFEQTFLFGVVSFGIGLYLLLNGYDTKKDNGSLYDYFIKFCIIKIYFSRW